MTIMEAKPDAALLRELIFMSAAWEAEDSCRGYRTNEPGDIEPNRIFIARQGDTLLGYLLGHTARAEQSGSVMADGAPYFEVEEIYVVPQRRSQGIGRALFSFAEHTVKAEGAEYLLLTTAAKDHKSILHFYIDELGMDFWSARLFKRL